MKLSFSSDLNVGSPAPETAISSEHAKLTLINTRPPQVRSVGFGKKERSVEFFVSPNQAQIEVCRGNYKAACVLANLLFRYQIDKHGKPRLDTYRNGSHWWVKDHDRLAAECRLTPDELRGARSKLEKWELLEAKRMKYFGKLAIYKDKTVMHWRLAIAGGSAGLSSYPSKEELLRMVLGWEFSCLHTDGNARNHKQKQEGREKEEEQLIQTVPDGTGSICSEKSISAGKEENGETTELVTKNSAPAQSVNLSSLGLEWVHYKRLAQHHDMDALLQLLTQHKYQYKTRSYHTTDRQLLADDECSCLERIEYYARPHFPDDSLEAILAMLSSMWDEPVRIFVGEAVEQRVIRAPA
ncbi:hypothetical protein [Burkholderia ambifaria]|uniref:hypothetical protein n=1 Tax=Burkholderia ambifaria TaxID=152480 RepID=UPI001589C501|nr:hypothetical protein [Burkholderia ambifaria]